MGTIKTSRHRVVRRAVRTVIRSASDFNGADDYGVPYLVIQRVLDYIQETPSWVMTVAWKGVERNLLFIVVTRKMKVV